MSKTPKEIIENTQRLRGERSQLNSLWEEVAEVLSPERMGFTKSTVLTHRTDKIFDTQPITAKRALVNSLGSMLRPKSAAPGKWFDIVPDDDKILDSRDVKEWIEFAEERLWKALYNPKAKFIEVTGEVDDDLVTFGTGQGFLGTRPDQSGLLFSSFHMKNVYIEVDSSNSPVSYYVIENMTPIQAANRWGEENLGAKTKEALHEPNKDKNSTKKFEFFWCVTARGDRDPRIKTNKNMPIQSIVVDVESESTVTESGFEETPFFTPRWDTRSGEVYGRGVGVLALPDVLTLNQMGKTMLRGLHRAVDPPWMLPADSLVNAPQMRPGGVSYYDAKAVRNLGMSDPFRQLDSKANIPWGLTAQTAAREQIQVLFFKNILNLPVSGPQMTATEILERREQFVREIGAVFGKLESTYTGPLVERAFKMMLRQGSFGDQSTIPEDIQKHGISFRFASPIEKAKRQIEEATVSQGIQKVLDIGQIQPTIMNRFDWDQIGKFIAESGDFPQQLTLSDDEVAALNQQQQQEAEAMKMMEQIKTAATAAGQVPDGTAEALVGMGGAEDI